MTSTIKVDTISENTSANGVAVDGVTLKDGGITATAPSTFSSTGNTNNFKIISTDDGTSTAPDLQFYKNSSSPAANDFLGRVDFRGNDDAGNETNFITMFAQATSVANGSETAKFDINDAQGTSMLELSTTSGSASAVFNEDSADIDFRVESDGRTHAFVVDAGTNTTMIGTNQTDFNAGADDLIVGTGSGDKGITIYTGQNAGDKGSIFFADGVGASDVATRKGQISYEHNNELMTFFTNDTEAMRIHLNQVISATAGIALGVGTANTASNVLDDYEEGTWTPTFTSGGNTLSISGGQTYAYTKVGNVCTVTFNIANCTVSGTAATGDNRITLPFTGIGGVRQPTSIISYFSSGGLRYTGADVLMGEVGGSVSFIQLQEWINSTGYRNISVAPTTGGGTYFWFTLTYLTA